MSKPIFLPVGSFRIPLFGLAVAIGLVVGGLVFVRQVVRRGIPSAQAIDMVAWIASSGLVGARLMYVIANVDYYLPAPQRILLLSQGGLSWFGGLAGGLVAAWLYTKRTGVPFTHLADALSPAAALGYAIARLGCDLYGIPTTVPWGVWVDGVRRHPTQLYAASASFLIYLHLRRWESRTRYSGELFLRYLALYGLIRFGLEFLRGEPVLGIVPLSAGQVVSVLLVVVASAVAFRRHRATCAQHCVRTGRVGR